MGEGARRLYLRRAGKTNADALRAPKKRQVEGVHSPGTAIALDSDQRLDRRTLGRWATLTRVWNLIRQDM